MNKKEKLIDETSTVTKHQRSYYNFLFPKPNFSFPDLRGSSQLPISGNYKNANKMESGSDAMAAVS